MGRFWASGSKVRGCRKIAKKPKCPLLDLILSTFLVCLCVGVSTAKCLSKSCDIDSEGHIPSQLNTEGVLTPHASNFTINRSNTSNNSANNSAEQGKNTSHIFSQLSVVSPVVSLKMSSTNLTAISSRSTDGSDGSSSTELESAAISIVIPFVAIIGTAAALVIMYKLTHKYHCCFSQEHLQRLSNFCDACNPNPQQYVYQTPADHNDPHTLRTAPPVAMRATVTSKPLKNSRS